MSRELFFAKVVFIYCVLRRARSNCSYGINRFLCHFLCSGALLLTFFSSVLLGALFCGLAAGCCSSWKTAEQTSQRLEAAAWVVQLFEVGSYGALLILVEETPLAHRLPL